MCLIFTTKAVSALSDQKEQAYYVDYYDYVWLYLIFNTHNKWHIQHIKKTTSSNKAIDLLLPKKKIRYEVALDSLPRVHDFY